MGYAYIEMGTLTVLWQKEPFRLEHLLHGRLMVRDTVHARGKHVQFFCLHGLNGI